MADATEAGSLYWVRDSHACPRTFLSATDRADWSHSRQGSPQTAKNNMPLSYSCCLMHV